MKIKNLAIFSICISVLCTAVRTVSLLYVTEANTGFFKSKLSGMGIFLSLTVFALWAVAVSFAFTAKEKPNVPYSPGAAAGILMIIFGITVIVTLFTGSGRVYTAGWQKAAECITGILAGGWFVAFGASAFKKLNIPPICAVFPCLYFVIRLIVVFTDFSTTALVGEHVFSLSYHCFVMIFALFLGRLSAGFAGKKHKLLFFPVAISALIFTATSVFSRIIVTALGKKQLIHGELPVDIVGVAFCIVLVFIILDIFRNVLQEEEENAV